MSATERPSTTWKRTVDEQEELLATGSITDAEAYARELWPPTFVLAVDTALAAFELDARQLVSSSSDDEVWAVVERAVLALNASDEEGNIETSEREELCAYVDVVLGEAGVDVVGLTSRRGLTSHEVTDQWREW